MEDAMQKGLEAVIFTSNYLIFVTSTTLEVAIIDTLSLAYTSISLGISQHSYISLSTLDQSCKGRG